MKKFFKAFTKVDWFAFLLSAILVLLTLVPLLPFVAVTDPWFLTTLISLGAVTLSSIVIAQIEARESGKIATREISSLDSVVRSSVDKEAVHEVPAPQIRSELNSLLEASTEWYFRGGSARWQRDTVMPTLARVTDRPVSYKVQIISPFDDELCDKYASYRRKSQPGDPRGDSRQIRLELLAFIFAAGVWQSRSKLVPDITLLRRFSPFRLDGNSDSFIITVADVNKNGLRSKAGNWYHTALLDEFDFEAGHATRLVLPAQTDDNRGAEDVREFFDELNMLNPDATLSWKPNFIDADWNEIFDLAHTQAT